jgi:hypothetical protein
MPKPFAIAAVAVLASWAALAGATVAHADDLRVDGARPDAARPDVATTFGNTVMSIYPDGRSQKIWMHPDGTWSGQSRKGTPLAGRWNMRGDKVCLRQSSPPTLPISFCQTFPRDPDLGLTSKDLTGQTIHLKIVKGITAADVGTQSGR